VIRDANRLYPYLAGQVRQIVRPDQVPNEAIRVVSYEGFKTLEAEPVLAAVLDEVLKPTDFVVGVGRQGRETGRVFVKVQNGQVKVVGMAK
jgi:hypothetical protein